MIDPKDLVEVERSLPGPAAVERSDINLDQYH